MVHLSPMAPKQTDPQFKLRLTPELKDSIEASAHAAGRSMNAEILVRLENSFSDENSEIEHVRLSLPKNVMNAAIVTALVYDQSLEEFVADAVKRETHHIERFREADEEIQILQDQVYELKRKLDQSDSDHDFIVLYSKAAQTLHFLERLLASDAQIPPDILKSAQEIAEITKLEMAVYRKRYQEAVKRHQDKVNSEWDWDWDWDKEKDQADAPTPVAKKREARPRREPIRSRRAKAS